MTTLLLDPDIRDWVVLPLFVIIVAAGLLRQSVGALLQGSKQKIPYLTQRAQNLLRQTTKIRNGAAAHFVSTYSWHVRKQQYAQRLKEQADWCQEYHDTKKEEDAGGGGGADDDDPMAAMMNNPMGMLKGNMAFMVQNMVMMQGIQHFFSGFILLKVPFPLTAGFRTMFQRGLADLPDLEPSYVSSVSWYFLVMYGLGSFFRLMIGDAPLEIMEQEQFAVQCGMQNPPNPGMKQDVETTTKTLQQEAENLEMFMQDFKSELDSVEKRLLGKQRYPKKKVGRNDEAGLLFASGRYNSKKKKAQ